MIAAGVLLLGIFGADAVYWLGMRSPDLSNNPLIGGNEKAEARQMGILYGNQALWIKRWTDELKKPGAQAILTVAAGALVAGGCFYVARLLDHYDEHADASG
jgi:hypothetical protein